MKYTDFENIMSQERMSRYLNATNGDTNKAMALYRANLNLSQEVFTVVGCFEVALRNAIDDRLKKTLGADWLRDSIQPGGIFDVNKVPETHRKLSKAYAKLQSTNSYRHSQLLATLDFGSWKHMFANGQYRATGQCLLKVFPNKPKSSAVMQYNNTYIFNELDKVNTLRNRIAHHEPICFTHTSKTVDTSYILNEYQKIQTLFMWMGIDSRALLYGLDHVQAVCKKINATAP